MIKETSFSDANQDVFTLGLLGDKGFFLDLGCSNGKSSNNTLLLERKGWTGLLFDSNSGGMAGPLVHPDMDDPERRTSPFILKDLSDSSIEDILDFHKCPRVIDYISLDIDQASFECLKRFPFSKYEFKFMTFEHDRYANRTDTIERKIEAPKLLHSLGYITLIEDVVCNGCEYEDWFANPKYIRKELIEYYSNFKSFNYKDIPIPAPQ